MPKKSPESGKKRKVLPPTIYEASECSDAEPASIDSYGHGNPTDRLQFGYSPAANDEAIAFHKRFSSEAWRDARKQRYLEGILKKGKLPANCEAVSSVFKLKAHWKKLSAFQQNDTQEMERGTEAFLDMIADQQNELPEKRARQ